MSLAALDGHAVTRGLVQVPAWGAWWADLDLADAEELTGAVTLTIGGATMQGTIVHGGAVDGRAAYRVVGGAGGWGRELPRRAYANDAGVKASLVLVDAARAAGETVAGLPTTRLGSHFARAEGPASAVLNLLAPRAWYVDADGVTRLGARPTAAYSGDGTRTRVDPAGRVIEVATEEIGELVPGVTVDGSAPATDVEYQIDPQRLTVRVYTGAPAHANRRARALGAILDALDPWRRYRGTFEFRVVTQSGDRLNLQPVRAASGLPDLARVPMRLPPGVRADYTPGALVLVTFVDGDPSRPCVISGDAPDAPGWMPVALELGGPGALGVARLTDPVIAGPFAGAITGGSARVKASL